jgi:hypothetical protein
MSDINTPEPPSRPDDELISSSSAIASAEASVDRQGVSTPPVASTIASEQKAEQKLVPENGIAAPQGAGEEVQTASAAPEETEQDVASDSIKPPREESSGEHKEKEDMALAEETELHDHSLQSAPTDEAKESEKQESLLAENPMKLEETSALDPLIESSVIGDATGSEAPGTYDSTHAHDVKEAATLQPPLGDDQDEKPIITKEASTAVELDVPTQEDITMREDSSTDGAQSAAPAVQIANTAGPTEAPHASAVPQSGSEEAALPPISSVLPNLTSSSKQNEATTLTETNASTRHGIPAPSGLASLPANIPTESHSSGNRRSSPSRASTEAQEKARQEEAIRLQKENEDMRLMWLSLPANDHLTYYSETEEEASSSANEGSGMAPKGAYGGMPLLSRTNVLYSNGKRKRLDYLEDERESSDSDDENLERQEKSEEMRFRTGNRGNKLSKGSRWNRRGKLGLWTEAKNEKEMHDRFMSRVKTIQRAGVESLLYNAPGPKAIQGGGPIPRDMLEGSDRMLLKDASPNFIMEENLQSTSLAPALLRPILTARALLESHTLRHTFRNPHIGALSKTALDLRESEGHLSRALGRCFGAMERMSAYVEDTETGEMRVNGSQNTDYEMDVKAIGAEGTAGTADEVNPALVQLDDLFVTKKGLPIPVASSEGGEEQARQSNEMQAILTTNQQRDVIRAALECLQDLGQDSLEYVERLDEVRGRLEGVKRRRTQVWEALRLWALKREDNDDNDDEIEEEEEIRPLAKTIAVTAGAPNRRKR